MSRVALCIAAVLLLAGAAGAAGGDPYLKSCYSSAPAQPCAALSSPFQGGDVEASPDGRHLYATVWKLDSSGFTGVRLFDVAADGAVAPRAGAEIALNGAPNDVDVSPDGRNVYIAAQSYLYVLNRDTSSGAIAQAQCFGLAPCLPIAGLGPSVDSVALSPDGTSLYGRGGSHVTVFDRNTANGQLTQKAGLAGCFAEDLVAPPCTPATGIVGTGLESAVSTDGRNLYVSTNGPGGVAVFNRAANGALSQAQCITSDGTSGSGGVECTNGADTLAQASAVSLDGRGEFAFVRGTGGTSVYRRDAASGLLTQADCLDEAGGAAPPAGCRELKGAAGSDVAVTPDGTDVVVNAQDFGVAFLALNRTTGQLALRSSRSCFSDAVSPPCEQVPSMYHGPGGVSIAPNGLHVFSITRVPPANGGSLASFERDAVPACQAKTVSVPRNTRVLVPLTCADANGDAMTLQIASPPRSGSLGAVDQAKDRVAYTPDENFKGTDSFQYRGEARGADGDAAKVTLNVLVKGRIIDRKPPNTRITRGPPKTTRSKLAVFRFVSTERGSRFECKFDKKRWASCRTPKRYRAVKRGRHTFRVRATDRAGNVDLSPARRTWIRKR